MRCIRLTTVIRAAKFYKKYGRLIFVVYYKQSEGGGMVVIGTLSVKVCCWCANFTVATVGIHISCSVYHVHTCT